MSDDKRDPPPDYYVAQSACNQRPWWGARETWCSVSYATRAEAVAACWEHRGHDAADTALHQLVVDLEEFVAAKRIAGSAHEYIRTALRKLPEGYRPEEE